MLETFTALADANRLRILALLRSGPHAVGEIGDRLALRQPQVSKHLKVLREAGLVEAQAEAQRRLYGLRAEGLMTVDAWLRDYRGLWDDRFNQLDELLEELQAKER